MTATIAFTGALFDGVSINEPYGAIVIQDEHIVWSGPVVTCPYDLHGSRHIPRMFPGLIDVHHHGGAGAGYKDDADQARQAAAHHHAMGSTSLIGSLVSATYEQTLANIQALAPVVQEGTLDGLHLEGPFISPHKQGAHDPHVIVDGNPAWFRDWCEAGQGTIRSITLAMETPHFDELIDICREYGIMPSLGHSNADNAQTKHALGADTRSGRPMSGPWTVTHLYNAMNGIHHRQPGPIPTLLHMAQQAELDFTVEIVPDGTHVAYDVIRMLFEQLGEYNAIIMITDAMDAAGLGDGTYQLGTLDVTVHNGVARLTTEDGSEGSIAGGTSRMFDNVHALIVEQGLNPAQVLRACTSTPARAYGLHDRGSLAAGCRADLLLLDDQLNRLGVLRAGKDLSCS